MLVFSSLLRRMMARWSSDSLQMCVRSVRWIVYERGVKDAEIKRGSRCAPADEESRRGFQTMLLNDLQSQRDCLDCWSKLNRVVPREAVERGRSKKVSEKGISVGKVQI